MQKRTRFLSILLTLVMLLGLAPAMGTTAAAADPEFSITLFGELSQSQLEKNEDVRVVIARLSNGYASGINEYYRNERTTRDEIIQYSTEHVNTVYRSDGTVNWEEYHVTLTCKYKLSYTVNGFVTYVEDPDRVVTINAIVLCPLKTVKLTGYTTPVAGKTLQPLSVPSDAGYTISRTWIELEGAGWEPGDLIPAQYAGQSDTLCVQLVASDGYPRFSYSDADAIWEQWSGSVYLNGEKFEGGASVRCDDTYNMLEVHIPFTFGTLENSMTTIGSTWVTTTKTVSDVAITGLDAPTHGKAGDYTATTSTAGCTVSGVQYTMFNKILDPYVGVKGDNLAIKVTVKAGSGYEFAKDVKATWNGIDSYSATVNAAGDECTFVFTYTVGAEEDAIIKALSMAVDAPVIGKAPATTATVGAGTRLESLTWEPADATFQEGVSYTVKGCIWADDAHLFMDDIVTNGTATVNGQAATMSKPATSGGAKQKFATGVYVSYTFPALNPDAPVITAQPKDVSVKAGADVTFTVTATGEALNYQWWMVDRNGSATKVGTNGPSYTIKAVNVADDNGTDYYCVVSNKAGEATSEKAHLTVSETAPVPQSAFTDVPETAYYNQPVAWAVEKGITNGTTATTFSPNATCTRAQIITFLWRAAGSPEPKRACSFTDIPAGSYFEKAVTWAAEQGMVGGDKFGPNDPCTRQMAVEFMWRQAGSPKAPAAGFTDVSSEAVNWALEEGVTTGTTETTFSPGSTCTRAQIVTFLWRAFGA